MTEGDSVTDGAAVRLSVVARGGPASVSAADGGESADVGTDRSSSSSASSALPPPPEPPDGPSEVGVVVGDGVGVTVAVGVGVEPSTCPLVAFGAGVADGSAVGAAVDAVVGPAAVGSVEVIGVPFAGGVRVAVAFLDASGAACLVIGAGAGVDVRTAVEAVPVVGGAARVGSCVGVGAAFGVGEVGDAVVAVRVCVGDGFADVAVTVLPPRLAAGVSVVADEPFEPVEAVEPVTFDVALVASGTSVAVTFVEALAVTSVAVVPFVSVGVVAVSFAAAVVRAVGVVASGGVSIGDVEVPFVELPVACAPTGATTIDERDHSATSTTPARRRDFVVIGRSGAGVGPAREEPKLPSASV